MSQFDSVLTELIYQTLNVFFLDETSLEVDHCEEKFKLRRLCQKSIKAGKGRGITTYFDPSKAKWEEGKSYKKHQVVKLRHQNVDIINTYRSQTCNLGDFIESLLSVIDTGRNTIVTGDFNICFNENRGNRIISYLTEIGFRQIVHEPTHIRGRLIDHVYWLDMTRQYNIEVDRYSPYYSDHDGLCITLTEKKS